MFTGKLFKF